MELDIEKINEEISTMNSEELMQQLLALKVRQRVAALKQARDPEKMRAQRQKVVARQKALIEKAKQLGVYSQILQEADRIAREKVSVQ